MDLQASGKVLSGPSISVAMTTYNGARFLREQLASIAGQNLLPLELVICDDGSTDATSEIVEEFARCAPFPVKMHRNPKQLGYADNFLRAASLCSGDLIAFCDQDDVWHATKLQLCAREFNDPDVMLCVHSGWLWDGEKCGAKCPSYAARQAYGPLQIYPLLSSYGFAMVLRRTLLSLGNNSERVPMEPGNPPMAHDQWVWLLAAVFGKIVLLPDGLVYYRQHGSNLFGGDTRSVTDSLAGMVSTRDYDNQAVFEARAAARLAKLASECPPEWRVRAATGANFLARCSEINSTRSKIHARQAPLPSRLRLFFSLVRKGGYSLGQLPARLGLRAALKDALFGIARIHGMGKSA